MSKYVEEREKFLSLNDVKSFTKKDKTKLVEKLLVFDKLIGLLVNWKTKDNEQSEEEVLKDLTFIPLMKCLYIVCLLSVHKSKKTSLFDVFDKFMAYQYGPVDEDCYYRINELPHYKFSDNEVITKRYGDGKQEFINNFTLTELSFNSISDNLNETFNMLEDAVTDLKNALYFPSFKEKDDLIVLTHRELWKNAWEDAHQNTSSYKYGKMDLNDRLALLKEARDLRGVIAA